MLVLAFPEGCKSYKGPHNEDCYRTIWLEVGCLKEGYGYPSRLTLSAATKLKDLNLRSVQTKVLPNGILARLNYRQLQNNFESIFLSAQSSDKQVQLECFGIGMC